VNKIVCAALLGALAAPAFSADVGVSISLGEPGFYGQIDIGNVARPPVVYAQPVMAVRSPQYVAVQPIYLHVPPGHEKHWSKHCAEYHACGRPVYFVRDDWYNKDYVPRYRREHGDHRDHGDRDDRGHDHGHHEDHDHDHDHGHGHDRDHDHD
jgi:hypothetical protein